MRLARFGVVGTLLVALVALGALVSLAATGLSRAGVLATLGLLFVAVAVGVYWGRRTAPRRWRTPYW